MERGALIIGVAAGSRIGPVHCGLAECASSGAGRKENKQGAGKYSVCTFWVGAGEYFVANPTGGIDRSSKACKHVSAWSQFSTD